MPNAFSKEEKVAFENVLEGFQDNLVLSSLVNKYSTDQTTMARTNDTIWRPMPYISQSFNGLDQTGNFKDYVQLSVPATIGFQKSVPFVLDALELRDALQEGRLGDAAKQKLASDVNVAVNNVASYYGSLVVKRTVAATGFDDVAQCDAIMNERGVSMGDRYAAYSTRDYNGMASNLAGRQTMQGNPQTAYERARVASNIAGFDVFKMDYTPYLASAAGGAITVNGANQYYTPKATSTAGTGETSNVDNRFQNLTVSATANVKAGDCFTLAGVNAVHNITKGDTGQLMTFRVVSVVNGTTLQITPPIISGGGSTDAELEYKNVTAAPANGAAITWLNTAAAYLNPFWHKSAIELLPGRIAFPDNAGMDVMRGTTDQGLELVMVKQGDIQTGKIRYRFDTRFGVVALNTQMMGVELFSQA